MRKSLILFTILLLAGCQSTKLIPEFVPPDVPEVLMEQPEHMVPITPAGEAPKPVGANDALKIIIHNYVTGELNAVQLESLQKYIVEVQKAIIEYNEKLKKK